MNKSRFLFNKNTLFTKFFVLLAFFLMILPSKGWSDEEQVSFYNIYSSGFHVLEAIMTVKRDEKKRTQVNFSARPYGFFGKIVPWNVTTTSYGYFYDEKFLPYKFESLSEWRGKIKKRELIYNNKGQLQKYIRQTEGEKAKSPKINKDWAKHTTDVLNVFTQVLMSKQPCNRSYKVYDGKRKFEIILGKPKVVDLIGSRYNVYKGQALQCTVKINRMNGFDRKESWEIAQEESHRNNITPTVWIAKREGKPFSEIVKLRVKTEFGTTFMHLADAPEQKEGEDSKEEKK